MHRLWMIASAAVVSASAAISQDNECADFGLGNAYLQAHFCAELQALGQNALGTRSATAGSEQDQSQDDIPPFAQLPVIRDAYRADPRATLELIERIKSAGGVVEQ